MIPIKINGKKKQIKPISELTTREYIDFMKIENPDKIKYIGFILKEEYITIFNSKISQSVLNMIGEIEDVTKLKPPVSILGYPIKRYGIETIGQRFQLDNCGLKGYELLVFMTAVAIVNNIDLDRVREFEEKLYNLPYTEVLPAGYFFFLRSDYGRKRGRRCSGSIMSRIRTMLSRKGQVSRISKSIPVTSKS